MRRVPLLAALVLAVPFAACSDATAPRPNTIKATAPAQLDGITDSTATCRSGYSNPDGFKC